MNAEAKFKDVAGLHDKVKELLDKEKHEHGVDWMGILQEQGESGLRRHAAKMLHATARKHKIHELISPEYVDSVIQVSVNEGSEVFAITSTEVDWWTTARGDQIENAIVNKLHAAQAMARTDSKLVSALTKISIGVSVMMWTYRAYKFYSAAVVAAEATEDSTVFAALFEVEGFLPFLFTTVFLAILIPILVVMQKQAAVTMLIVNNTDDDLSLTGRYRSHGKEVSCFYQDLTEGTDPGASTYPAVIPKRALVPSNLPPLPPGRKPPQNAIWCGLYVASKHDDALYGSEGAIGFGVNDSLPHGAKIGWEIPLTFLGGDNRAYGSITHTESLKNFTGIMADKNVTHNEDSVAGTSMTTAINSTKGSLGYMVSVISTPLPRS